MWSFCGVEYNVLVMISEKDEKKLIQHLMKWNNDISFSNYKILYSSKISDFFYLFTSTHIFHFMKGFEGDGIKVMTAKTSIFTQNGRSYENSDSHFKKICPCVKTKLKLNDLTSLKFKKSNENIITMFEIDEKYYTDQRNWIDPSKNQDLMILLANTYYDYEIVDEKMYIRMLLEEKNLDVLKDIQLLDIVSKFAII